jgi:triosephosphate isomerase
MMRRPIIAANWKLNKTVAEARQFVEDLQRQLPDALDLDIVLAAPFTALAPMQERLQGTPFHLAAQDVFWERSGAYTGEISTAMLTDVGCTYVIIGHSERRQYFGETDATVCRKVRAAFEAGLTPIVCVGESLPQRQANETFAVVAQQIRAGLADCDAAWAARAVLAYEPIWAIGTGETATPEQAQEVHHHIRVLLADIWDDATAERVRIQYGGSVNPANVSTLMAAPDIDGALVGGASLDVHSFVQIVSYRGSTP